MITQDYTGKCLLSFENKATIRRIPLERRGMTKKGIPWVLGSCLVEVFDNEQNCSAQLFLVTFEPELIEQINVIGVGKNVKIRWHIDCRERYDSYSVSAILDEIEFLTENENFLLNKKKKVE